MRFDKVWLNKPLKVRNRKAVLGVFRDGGEYTISDIAKQTGISRQTIMKVIQFFTGKRLIDNTGKGDSTEYGGKKPELYALAANSLFLSIVMWPNNLILTLSDMRRRRIGMIHIDAPLPHTPDEAFAVLSKHARDLLSSHTSSAHDLYGITLSTSGIIDYDRGSLLFNSQQPEWGVDTPLLRYMRDIFGEDPVIVIENAGKMTGRTELTEGDFLDKRVVVIFSTWGLSACFIDKGRILSGSNSLIGEIGHMTVDPHYEEACGCGSHGCLEQLVSLEHIVGEVAARPAEHALSELAGLGAADITFADLFAASAKGDAFMRSIVKVLASHFATALRNITLSFDPDFVVFQGNYALADEFFCAQLKEQMSHFRYYQPKGPFEVRFDTRPLFNLDVAGSLNCLYDLYYQDPALYLDQKGKG